ncbi:MAG: lipase secretion chaperone [Burkholderiaceae bacterium]|nr:lipase secretion chaperone [Burkholderiaceae bacterium]
MRKRQLLASAVLAAAVFCLCLILKPAGIQPQQPQFAQAARDDNPFTFVKSMEGTTQDGQPNVADNSVVADAELRHMFDYYLGAIGEKTLPQIHAEIELQLTHQLPATALPSAKQLLERYIAYKTALVDLEKAPPQQTDANPLRARMIAMRQVRQRYFSPKEIAGMWGAEDTYDDDAVARWEIMQDPHLNAEQKRAKLAKLDAAMPPALRAEREAPLKVALEEDKAKQMRAAGAGEDEIYRMRAATFSPEAAARMAAVDQENAQWKSRIGDYLEQRNKLLGDATLSDANRQTALQQLRDAKFSAMEQKRLGAYE